MQPVTTDVQPVPHYLSLSDVALEAAVELENFRIKRRGSFIAVSRLAQGLRNPSFGDLSLFPVYERALAGRGASEIFSKDDLYSRIADFAEKLRTINSESLEGIETLRDFCLAMHEALLNRRMESIPQTTIFRASS